MNRINSLFSKLHRPALIGYLVAGDPDKEESLRLIETAIESGLDLLEIGIPHSDPIADGPVITEAHGRALSSGMTLDGLFSLVCDLRSRSDIPVVLMTYFNPVYRRGVNTFYEEAKNSGVDGVLIVDLPPEEAGDVVKIAAENDIMQIFLVTPTTDEKRLINILSVSSGYCYIVSVQGVTGMQQSEPKSIESLISRVKSRTKLPIAVGFGINSPGQVRNYINSGADAVIVGTPIVNIVKENIGQDLLIHSKLREFIQSLAVECRRDE